MQNDSIHLLRKLLSSLFFPAVPSEAFIGSLIHFTTPSVSIPLDSLDSLLPEKALEFYRRLSKTEANQKMVYVLLALKESSRNATNHSSIKQCALGIIPPPSKAPVCMFIHSLGVIYRHLRIEQSRPTSLTHKYFLEEAVVYLRKYEESVLKCPSEPFGFYCEIFFAGKCLRKIGQLNDLFRERDGVRLLYKDPSQATAVIDCKKVILRLHNECVVSYMLTGTFEDPHSEFFIKNHTLDYGLIPGFVLRTVAESVLYVGKYTAFLKSADQWNHPPEIQEIIRKIDLSANSSSNYIQRILESVNKSLMKEFFQRLKVFELLEFIQDTFLFGRIDFITCLFQMLAARKRKENKKGISSLLETALINTFPGSPFTAMVDIYLGQDGLETENFSLYMKTEYPVSLLIEEEFVIKLVYIFKFLWKLKKIDFLAQRVRNLKYLNLVQRIQFYVFNQVISENRLVDACSISEGFMFDEIKKTLNKKLDGIMKGLFINSKNKTAERFLFSLEKYLIGIGKGETVDEEEVSRNLKELQKIVGTCI